MAQSNERSPGNGEDARSWSRVTPHLGGKPFSEYLGSLLADAGVATREVAAGEVIFDEGDEGDCAFVVDRGSVRIVTAGPGATPRVLAILGPGELFGEMAVLDRPQRSASAVAAETCRLFVLPKADILSLVHDVPQAALWMLNILARRLARMDRAVGQMERLNEVNLKILAGQEAERRRIGRDLHDGPAQCFADYVMRLQIIERLLSKKPEAAVEEIGLLKDSLKDGLGKIRELIYGLHPKELARSGLVGAVEKFVEKQAQTAGFTVEFRPEPLGRELPQALEATLYCIVQEALNNARKHAAAKKVAIDLGPDGTGGLRLVVADDGAGFDVEALLAEYADRQSYGLSSMEERITLAGGTMDVTSAPGRGTTLTFTLPLPGDDAGAVAGDGASTAPSGS